MRCSKRILNLLSSLRSNWIKCLCVLILAPTSPLMADDVEEGDCREGDGTQYVCTASGWAETSGESSCPAATPNDTCADEMVPGVLGEQPGGPSGGTYDPSEGTVETPPPPPETPDSIQQACADVGGVWIRLPWPLTIFSYCHIDDD